MFRAALLDPYVTHKKVYAEGMRSVELPLPRPQSKIVADGTATLAPPNHRKPRRRMFRRLNHFAVPGYAPICMDSNDPQTITDAFLARLMRDVPTAEPEMLKKFHAFVKKEVRRLPKASLQNDRDMFEDWIAETPYPEKRKADLRNCFEELRGGFPSKRACQKVNGFIKSEFYLSFKNARMINSRSDAFKVFAGPLIKKVEKIVYSQPQFIKHTPVPERPAKVAALKRAGLRVFNTDYTAFESHFVKVIMKICECELYSHVLSNSAGVQLFIQTVTGVNMISTRSGFKARVTARRMSGEMSTSLGNGFTNWCLAKFLAQLKGGHIDGFVEGDDGIFVTDVELTADDFKKLGFTIKIVEVDDPSEASFCGIVTGTSNQIIRDPRKFMAGFGWTQSFINAGARVMDELQRAKALSTVYETPHCPIVGVFARQALKLTRHVHPRFVEDGYHRTPDEVAVPEFAPTLETRQLFERMYHISPELQVLVEAAVLDGDMAKVSSLLPPNRDMEVFAMNYLCVG